MNNGTHDFDYKAWTTVGGQTVCGFLVEILYCSISKPGTIQKLWWGTGGLKGYSNI
jgi:hypothetical protein